MNLSSASRVVICVLTHDPKFGVTLLEVVSCTSGDQYVRPEAAELPNPEHARSAGSRSLGCSGFERLGGSGARLSFRR
jgi:hypothetical protein